MDNRLFSLLLLVIAMILSVEAEANDRRSILVLHSYHRGLTWDDSIDQGIAKIMVDHPDVAVRTEYMDTKRIHDKEYYTLLLKILKHKFAGLHFDVVISTDNNALDFLLEYRDELFPDTPVVFCGVNNFKPSMLGDAEGFTGVTESIAVQRTLDAALDLNPEIKHVYIFGTNSSTYQGNKAMFLQAMPDFENKLEFIFYDEANIEKAIKTLSSAPKNSIAFIIAFLRDKSGNFVSFEEATTIISERSDIPLFGLWDYLLGHGVVGGLVISGFAQGESAAQIALDIINEKPVEQIPYLLTSPNRYIFDYQQLNRFGFNSDRLPDKSTIINLPNSFYSNYKVLIWVVISCAIILITIIIALILNILSRKRAETELKASEAQYRTTLESMNDIIHVVDSEFNLVLVNQAFEQQANSMGIEGNVAGRNLFELFPFLSENVHKEYGQAVDKGKLIATEEMVTIQGEDKYTETRKIPILSSNRVNQIVTVIRDITARKKAEELLRESEEKYRVLFETMPLGITVSDEAGNIIESNSVSEKLLGISKKEQEQRSIDGEEWKIVRPDGSLMPDDEYASVLALKENRIIGNVEMGIVKTADRITWINVTATPIPLEKYGVLVVYGDITEKKQAQEQINASLKEKETLLHEVHHRVKNNMQVINSLLKLQSNNIEDEQTKEILKDSQSRVYTMSAVHESLHGSEKLSEIDLKTYLTKITTSVFQMYSIDHRKVKLNSNIGDSPISINQAYPLGLVINELISNSLKYAFPEERSGEITVKIKILDAEIELTVMDDGVGISDSLDWKDSSTLGLKLVRTLVENQLDGSIDMQSNNGTKFTIKFNIET